MKLLHRTSPSRFARVDTEGNVVVGLPKPSLNGGCLKQEGRDREGEEKQLKLFAKALIQRKDTKK